MNPRFPVIVNGQWREAKIHFATEKEVRRLSYWRLPQMLPENSLVARKMFDAVEFARLASKRWSTYYQEGATASGLQNLAASIERHPNAEVAMVLIARSTWGLKTSTLGIAYLRRTWCHHLFLEFFATHPNVIAKRPENIGGVGVGILGQIVSLARILKIPCIWGEATEFSAPWYEDQLGVEKVLDHFFIEAEVMEHCCHEFHNSQERMLARRIQM